MTSKARALALILSLCATLSSCEDAAPVPVQGGEAIPAVSGFDLPKRVTTIASKGQVVCQNWFSCFEITPDSKGVVSLNPQQQLYFLDASTGERTKIADTSCSNRGCFSLSPDGKSIAFTRQVTDEMLAYVSPLPGGLKRAFPRKLGKFPRYAGSEPKQADYQLQFCGSNDVVFARSIGPGFNTSSVHAFHEIGTRAQRTDLFFEAGGRAGNLSCDPDSQKISFLAQKYPSPGEHREQLLQSSHSMLRDAAAPLEILYERDSDPEYQIVQKAKVFPGLVALILQNAAWDPFPLSSLISRSDAGDKPIAQFENEKVEEVLGKSNDRIVFQLMSFNGRATLQSVSTSTGERVSLTQEFFSLSPGILEMNQASGKTLFLEEKELEKHLVVSDAAGKNREALMNWGIVPLPGERLLLNAKLTPNGKCAVVLTDTPSLSGPVQLETIEVETGVRQTLLSSPVEYAHVSDFRVAPNSSFVVFYGDVETRGDYYVYLAQTANCQ